jgi:predicted CoA-binding protein
MSPQELLATVETILLIDWPERRVPETLVHAGFRVFVRGGPGPQDFSVYELLDGEVTARRTGPPERADLIYAYRPLTELPEIVTLAQRLGAKAIWTQSGLKPDGTKAANGCWLPEADLQQARHFVESAGLIHVAAPYIADSVR